MAAAKEPTILSVEQIIEADDRPIETVLMPEWGGAVKVRGLSLGQFQDIDREATVNGEPDMDRRGVLMLLEGIVEPKFSREQAQALREKSLGATERLVVKISELSHAGEAALKAAERTFRS